MFGSVRDDEVKHGLISKNLEEKPDILLLLDTTDRKLKGERNFWEKSSAGKLMGKMNEVFGLNIYELEFFSSTEFNTEDIKDEELKKKLEKCLKEEKCEEHNGMFMDLGRVFHDIIHYQKIHILVNPSQIHFIAVIDWVTKNFGTKEIWIRLPYP